MALCGTSILSSNYHHGNHLLPINRTKAAAACSISSSYLHKCGAKFPADIGRRTLNVSTLGFLLSFSDQPFSRLLLFSNAMASQVLELNRYTDSSEGFTLLIPSSWTKVILRRSEFKFMHSISSGLYSVYRLLKLHFDLIISAEENMIKHSPITYVGYCINGLINSMLHFLFFIGNLEINWGLMLLI